jgi:alpha-glucosidase (family GH31 glycosyl hydrolase)
MKRFTAYRTMMSQRDTHNHYMKNPDDQPQFEGVVWTDGTCAIRWFTACSSTSVWNSLEDMLNIHGHPEYGTKIIWHDGDEPEVWTKKVKAYEMDRAITS